LGVRCGIVRIEVKTWATRVKPKCGAELRRRTKTHPVRSPPRKAIFD
jgi:hypothetical protein